MEWYWIIFQDGSYAKFESRTEALECLNALYPSKPKLIVDGVELKAITQAREIIVDLKVVQ